MKLQFVFPVKSDFRPLPTVDQELDHQHHQCDKNLNRRESGFGWHLTVAVILLLFTFLCGFIWFWHWNNDDSPLTDELKTIDFLPDNNDSSVLSGKCDVVPAEFRFDCDPRTDADEKTCLDRGCCWNPVRKEDSARMGIPFCYYPPGFANYRLTRTTRTRSGLRADYQLSVKSGYPKDAGIVRMDVMIRSGNSLRVKIYDPKKRRFEVPLYYYGIDDEEYSSNSERTQFRFKLSKTNFGFIVTRTNGEVM